MILYLQADGKIVPHGLYDVHRNIGYITLGISNDTSEFAGECVRQWRLNHGQIEYPNRTYALTKVL